jgi:hypothetical protein
LRLAHNGCIVVRFHEFRHHVRNIHSQNCIRFPGDLSNEETAPRDKQLVKHHLFIVACVEYLRQDVELMIVVLGGLGQLRSDIEFLFLKKS